MPVAACSSASSRAVVVGVAVGGVRGTGTVVGVVDLLDRAAAGGDGDDEEHDADDAQQRSDDAGDHATEGQAVARQLPTRLADILPRGDAEEDRGDATEQTAQEERDDAEDQRGRRLAGALRTGRCGGAVRRLAAVGGLSGRRRGRWRVAAGRLLWRRLVGVTLTWRRRGRVVHVRVSVVVRGRGSCLSALPERSGPTLVVRLAVGTPVRPAPTELGALDRGPAATARLAATAVDPC